MIGNRQLYTIIWKVCKMKVDEERYESIGKKIDKGLNGTAKPNENYETVVKEIDAYFKKHNL